jgi:uncharacterized protein
MINRVLAAALLACAAVLPAHAAVDAEAEWREWRKGQDAYYSTVRFAVLKVNDAIFLKPGQKAFVPGRPDEPSSYRWSLEPMDGSFLSVEFARKQEGDFEAQLVQGEKTVEAFGLSGKAQVHQVNPAIDIEGRLSGEGTEDLRLQLKIFNQEHPAAKNFRGLEFFEYAPDFRIKAVYEPAAKPDAVILDTERGLKKRFFRHGAARFTLEGETVRMPLYALEESAAAVQDFFTLFTDETTGGETYGVGRYMDVKAPGADAPATMLIDFNRAYNPLCARSEHYNCPLVDFHIPVAIRAGEKAPPK